MEEIFFLIGYKQPQIKILPTQAISLSTCLSWICMDTMRFIESCSNWNSEPEVYCASAWNSQMFIYYQHKNKHYYLNFNISHKQWAPSDHRTHSEAIKCIYGFCLWYLPNYKSTCFLYIHLKTLTCIILPTVITSWIFFNMLMWRLLF